MQNPTKLPGFSRNRAFWWGGEKAHTHTIKNPQQIYEQEKTPQTNKKFKV